MAQSVACLKRTSLISGEAEEVELKAMWPARVLLTMDEHCQPSNCRGIQETQSTALTRNGPHPGKPEARVCRNLNSWVAKLGLMEC